MGYELKGHRELFFVGTIFFWLVGPKIKIWPIKGFIIDNKNIKYEKTNIPFKTIFYHNVWETFLS